MNAAGDSVGASPEGVALNAIEADLQLRAVTLRSFRFLLLPLRSRGAIDGLELRAIADELGLTVSLRFDRSEFVNIATTGLQMIDAADAAADANRGGETQ